MVLRLAWRSLWRHRRRTLITLSSIGLGLSIAVFFVALAEGVYDQLIHDAVRMNAGHLTLEHPDYRQAPAVDLWVSAPTELRLRLEDMPEVESTKLLVLGQGMAKTAARSVGIAVMGVEPERERRSSPLARDMVQGRYLQEGDGALAVIGSDLARQLDIGQGKKLVLAANDARGELVEELCRVAGVFETGVEEIDGYLVQLPVDFARRLFGLPADAVTQWGVVLARPGERREVAAAVRTLVDPVRAAVRPWEEVLPELAAYVKVDRASNLVMQGLLVTIILFTIFNTLLMSVLERAREFAVLLALGTSPWTLRAQVAAETALLGLMGCLVGLAVGGGASWWVQVYGWDLSSLYSEGISVSGFAVDTVIHARVTPAVLLGLGAVVFGATLLMGLAPVRRAGRTPVVENLR